MASQRDVKQSKELVQTLLRIQGEDYNNWIHAQHQAYINEHQDLLIQSLLHYQEGQEGKREKASPKEANTNADNERQEPSTIQGVNES